MLTHDFVEPHEDSSMSHDSGVRILTDAGMRVPFHVTAPKRNSSKPLPKRKSSKRFLEDILVSRLRMNGYEGEDPGESLPQWGDTFRIVFAVYIHFRSRGTFLADTHNLGLGEVGELRSLCRRITGISPREAQRECLRAGSILPFVDRCLPCLLSDDGRHI